MTDDMHILKLDYRQFRKLLHLSNKDIAERMAVDLKYIKELRKVHHQLDIPLYQIRVPYGIRLLLGKHNIKTTTDLFNKTDKELLEIPGIGEYKVKLLRQLVKEYFQ